MPTTDELHAADQVHALAIAEIKAAIRAHDESIERHDQHIAKLDETVATLREAYGRVATKDDILELRTHIGEKFDKQLTDAQNAVPGKYAAIFTGGAVVIAVIELFLRVHG
ncbi:hypothetical protein [Pararobbsia silviterrae]|uniref:Uncharacterized protein n=1 Tax=Pararobbsia silviterrae TaxID=1792498 RepID=A0A494Y4E4_9BURK|nr:hypothetical protein [Pararobbsia silviterrae]RKP56353.1 hypothetical protein D7S86_08110 [Pararobbsia silviterrae]